MRREIFAASVRELREAGHFTQWELALALGVSPRTITRWEAGEAYPKSIYVFEAIGRLRMVYDLRTAE